MLIHEHSRGIPRTISVMCDNALLSGMALGAPAGGPGDRDRSLQGLRPAGVPTNRVDPALA